MPKKRVQNEQPEGEPKTKARKSVPKTLKNKDCYICNLPNDVLEKIVGYIHFWHRPRLRKSCKRMQHICDSVLMHEFLAAIFQFNSKDPYGYEYAALMAIKEATWPYVLNGFESIFCGAILPLIWDSNNFCPDSNKTKFFLKHFYKMVDEKIGDSYSQFSRLLYSITLMGLLRKFRHSQLVPSILIPPNYWRIVLELRGPWIGVLWTSKSVAQPHQRSKLLMILCEILIADRTHRAYKYAKIWDCESEIFMYGNDASEGNENLKNATTVFTFRITAATRIISLLKSCLEENEIEWPKRLPKSEFVVLIDIACREALKWGCCQVHHLEIGPYFDVSIEDGQDEFGNEDALIPKKSVDRLG